MASSLRRLAALCKMSGADDGARRYLTGDPMGLPHRNKSPGALSCCAGYAPRPRRLLRGGSQVRNLPGVLPGAPGAVALTEIPRALLTGIPQMSLTVELSASPGLGRGWRFVHQTSNNPWASAMKRLIPRPGQVGLKRWPMRVGAQASVAPWPHGSKSRDKKRSSYLRPKSPVQ